MVERPASKGSSPWQPRADARGPRGPRPPGRGLGTPRDTPLRPSTGIRSPSPRTPAAYPLSPDIAGSDLKTWTKGVVRRHRAERNAAANCAGGHRSRSQSWNARQIWDKGPQTPVLDGLFEKISNEYNVSAKVQQMLEEEGLLSWQLDLERGQSPSPQPARVRSPEVGHRPAAMCHGHFCEHNLLIAMTGLEPLQRPYQVAVRYNLEPVRKALGTRKAFLTTLSTEKLRHLGRGWGVDALEASKSWLARDCMCSDLVPLKASKATGEIRVTLHEDLIGSCPQVLLGVVGIYDTTDAQDWLVYGDLVPLQLVVRPQHAETRTARLKDAAVETDPLPVPKVAETCQRGAQTLAAQTSQRGAQTWVPHLSEVTVQTSPPPAAEEVEVQTDGGPLADAGAQTDAPPVLVDSAAHAPTADKPSTSSTSTQADWEETRLAAATTRHFSIQTEDIKVAAPASTCESATQVVCPAGQDAISQTPHWAQPEAGVQAGVVARTFDGGAQTDEMEELPLEFVLVADPYCPLVEDSGMQTEPMEVRSKVAVTSQAVQSDEVRVKAWGGHTQGTQTPMLKLSAAPASSAMWQCLVIGLVIGGLAGFLTTLAATGELWS